jgi:[ribosomal protein S5]-alanine N-acetyltransferase
MTWPDLIHTDRLVLRRPVLTDASAIFDGYARDPEVVRYLMWRPHGSIHETEAFLETRLRGWEAGDDLTWALTLKGDDRLIGMIAVRLRGFKPDIGYVLARPYWGRGLMAEAGRVIVDLALTDPAVHRVWAVCDAENRASARVLEKLGMTLEGVLQRWVLHPNVSADPRDALCYARVRT